MSDEELIERLREHYSLAGFSKGLIREAIDRIEALIADRDKQAGYKEDYRAAYGEACLQLQETEAKLAKAVEALEWQTSQPEANPFMVAHARAALPARGVGVPGIDGWVRRLRKTEEAGHVHHLSKADRLAIADFLAALAPTDAAQHLPLHPSDLFQNADQSPAPEVTDPPSDAAQAREDKT